MVRAVSFCASLDIRSVLAQHMGMARRRRSSALARTTYTPAPRAPAPIIRVSAPRPITTKKLRVTRRRHSVGSTATARSLTPGTMLGVGVGGAAMGFIESHFGSQIPSVPLIGRKGLLAVIAYMASKHGIGGTIARDVAVAAAAVSGYELAKSGSISGE